MSEQKQNETEKPQVRTDEPELSDDALEQVAGGCAINSEQQDIFTRPTPTFPTFPTFPTTTETIRI